jgi:hypothetical protein
MKQPGDLLQDAPQIQARRGTVTTARRPWTWRHYLALAGVPFLVWESWTLVAWLAHGPQQVTRFRDTSSASWYAARIYEVIMVLLSLAVLSYVIRGCRRQRRLTWDAQLCIAGLLAYWQDPLPNFFQPTFLYSSQWVNLTNWCGQAPFVVNKDCSRIPEPVLFMGLLYTTSGLASGIVGCWLLRQVRQRFPSLSVAQMFAICVVFACVVDLVLEVPATRLHLWNYPGDPNSFALFGGSHRYPLFLWIDAGIFFAPIVAIRFFKNDSGETVLERGLTHLSPRRRTMVSLFATIGVVQIMLLGINLTLVIGGPYAGRWQGYPRHVINGVCNTAGFQNTAYGTCPGDPGYLAPLRRLPGKQS